MRRMAIAAAAVAVVAVVMSEAAAKRLRIPPGHYNDPPKTVEDQNRENAARAAKQQKKEQANQPQPVAQPPRPTTAPTALLKAQGALERVEKRLREQFEKGEDYTKAAGALKSAQDSYDVAYQSLVVKLGDDSAYAAAAKAQKGAEAELAKARQEGRATDAAALAGKVMEAKKAVHKIEADAAEKDDGVKDAKAKVAEAKGAVDELKKGFEEKMKEDPDYVAAVHAVEEAKGTKA